MWQLPNKSWDITWDQIPLMVSDLVRRHSCNYRCLENNADLYWSPWILPSSPQYRWYLSNAVSTPSFVLQSVPCYSASQTKVNLRTSAPRCWLHAASIGDLENLPALWPPLTPTQVKMTVSSLTLTVVLVWHSDETFLVNRILHFVTREKMWTIFREITSTRRFILSLREAPLDRENPFC